MPSSCWNVSFAFVDLVFEGDLHALVQVAGDLESFADRRGVELDLREDRGVRPEADHRARAARRAQLLHRRHELALAVLLLPEFAVALDRDRQFLRQRADHAGADAVEAAGRLVVLAFELAAGVQRREHHFECALLGLRVFVDRNAAAVVDHRDRRAVFVERQRDARGVAVHRLVDRVVEDLPDQVVQAGRPDAADIHTGTFPDGLEPLQNGNVFRGVSGHSDQLGTWDMGRGTWRSGLDQHTPPNQPRSQAIGP